MCFFFPRSPRPLVAEPLRASMVVREARCLSFPQAAVSFVAGFLFLTFRIKRRKSSADRVQQVQAQEAWQVQETARRECSEGVKSMEFVSMKPVGSRTAVVGRLLQAALSPCSH